MADAREYETRTVAKKYDNSIPKLSDVEMHKRAEEEIDDCMMRAREYAWTVERATEYEMEAQAIARKYNLHIPKLSNDEIRIKAQEEIDDYMTNAREHTVTVDRARQCEKQAQDMAKMYNLPIPELSDIDIHAKAEEEVEEYMRIARQYSTSVDQARECEKKAQEAAKKYNIHIPVLSDIEIHIKAKWEVEEYMRKAYYKALNVEGARYYEKKAQDVARTHDLPTPELSDDDIEIIRQRER
jgi:hypothetical protein